MRTWKPGDVAMRTAIDGTTQRSVFVHSFGCRDKHTAAPHWHHANAGWDPDETRSLSWYRPLVIIDPEDRKQVGRLVESWFSQADSEDAESTFVTRMQAALASLLASDKPAEPTGRFAEVVNAEGMKYYLDPAGLWRRFSDGTPRAWAAVGATKVLSDGVLP